jgi:ankyrin repeat protein
MVRLLSIWLGHKEAAIYLLDHGAEVNSKDNQGFTPLHFTAHEGHLPLVDLLVLRRADLNLANFEGSTPLTMAAQNSHVEVFKFLIEKGVVVDQANVNGTALTTALTTASLTGHFADINHLCARGMSPLYAAAREGHIKVVKLLVNKGANIHQATNQGTSPLHRAAQGGHQEVVDYLMSKGATFEATGTLAKVCKCCGAADASLIREKFEECGILTRNVMMQRDMRKEGLAMCLEADRSLTLPIPPIRLIITQLGAAQTLIFAICSFDRPHPIVICLLAMQSFGTALI